MDPLDEAIIAHSKWKARLRNYIAGQEQIDPAVLGRDDQCDLGKWILGDGNKHGNLSLFADLKAKHTKFHAAAASVVRSAKSLPQDKAFELLDSSRSEFGQASSAVVNAITKLKAVISK